MRTTQPALMCSVALLIVFGFATPSTTAQAQDLNGLEIAREAERRNRGFGDFIVDFKMIHISGMDHRLTYTGRLQTLEVDGDGDKSLIIWDHPKSVKGTALLSYTHKVGPHDIWTYVPKTKRVKRISSRKLSDPFMGSAFSYEDVASQEVEHYTHKYLGDERWDGRLCYKVERRPLNIGSGYSRQVVWYDQEDFRIWRIDYYDRTRTLLKTLTYDRYQQYLDQYWLAKRMLMVNRQTTTTKRTEFIFQNYKFRTGLTSADFNRNTLKRLK